MAAPNYKPHSPWPALHTEHSPPSPATADILFIQGLGSSYPWCWTAPNELFWLRSLLPSDVPSCRILTFEYDSRWHTDPAIVSLDDCATRLLQCLIAERTHAGDTTLCPRMQKRPIVLVGHSYGGLVVKAALVKAVFAVPQEPWYQAYQAVLRSVVGVVFLGTPHNGSNYAQLGLYQAAWQRLRGQNTNPEILRPLVKGSPSSKTLHDLQRGWERVEETEEVKGLQAWYFCETKPLAVGLVVDKDSAFWGAKHGFEVTLEKNHMEMNKFGSAEDTDYKLFARCLWRILEEAGMMVEARWGMEDYSSSYCAPELREARTLIPKVEMGRLETTRDRLRTGKAEGTCEWATQMNSILRWADHREAITAHNASHQDQSVLIHGKPGSGKSTLSVFLYDWMQKSILPPDPECAGTSDSPSCINRARPIGCALLYFTFSGHEDVTLVIGTLIHQLLLQYADTPSVWRIALRTLGAMKDKGLSPTSAITLLLALVKSLTLTYIIVDGVDECREGEQLMEMLQWLCQCDEVRLLILCRKDVIVEKNSASLFRGQDCTIDLNAENGRDIDLFIRQQVQKLAEEDPKVFTEPTQALVEMALKEKAANMFQWVKLIIAELRYQGSSAEDVERTLEHFPVELAAAYAKSFMRQKMVPGFDSGRMKIALMWLACSSRPLTVQELRMAIALYERFGNDHIAPTTEIDSWSPRVLNKSEEELRQEFHVLLGPLVTFYTGKDETPHITIHICHHSLRQLLIEGSESLAESFGKEFSFRTVEAHALAAQTCMQALCAEKSLWRCLDAYYDLTNVPPFLGYAFENWAHHLQISNVPVDCDHDLIAWLDLTLRQTLYISLSTLLGLSQVLDRLDFDALGQMMQTIAFRDLHQHLAASAEFTTSVAKALPGMVSDFSQVRQLLSTTARVPAFHIVNPNSKLIPPRDIRQDMGALLDCQVVIEVFARLDVPYFESAYALREASRRARRLSCLLAVDPIRSFLYRHIGENGLKPIPVLAHTCLVMDLYTSVPFLARRQAVHELELRRLHNVPLPISLDLRRQYDVVKEHPFHGHFRAARMELDEYQSANNLTDEFYREHILESFKPKIGEWVALQLIVQLMETPTPAHKAPEGENQENTYEESPGYTFDLASRMNALIYAWRRYHLKYHVPLDEPEIPSTSRSLQSRHFNMMKPRAFTLNPLEMGDMLSFSPMFVVAWGTKLCMSVYYPVQGWLHDLYVLTWGRFELFPGYLRVVRQTWTYLPVSAAIYAVRMRYAPWLLASMRRVPIKDLTGLWRDPLNYKAEGLFKGWSRKWIVFSLFGDILARALFVYFPIFAAAGAEESVSSANPDSLIPGSQQTGTSSSGKIVRKTLLELLSDGLIPASKQFLGLLFIEYSLFDTCYVIYDAIHLSVRIFQPSRWSWGLFLEVNTSLAASVFVKQIGLLNTLVLLGGTWVYHKLRRILPSPLELVPGIVKRSLREVWATSVVPAVEFTLNAINPLWSLLHNRISQITERLNIQSFLSKIPAIPTVGRKTLIIVTLTPVVLLFGSFVSASFDPLRVKKSKKLRRRVQKLVNEGLRALGETKPAETGWRGASKKDAFQVGLRRTTTQGTWGGAGLWSRNMLEMKDLDRIYWRRKEE